MTKSQYMSNVSRELGNKLNLFILAYDMPPQAMQELACIAKSLGFLADELKALPSPHHATAPAGPARPKITPRAPTKGVPIPVNA